MQDKNKDIWEKQFDEKFRKYTDYRVIEGIKQFITDNFISKEELKEVLDFEKAGFYNKEYKLEEKFTNGYNQALSDIKDKYNL